MKSVSVDRGVGPVEGLLFDYGGTLDGSASHWLDRFVGFYREIGVGLPFDDIRRAFYRADEEAYGDPRVAHMSLRELMELHVAVQLDELAIDGRLVHTRLVERFVDQTTRALQASRQTLTELSASYRLGVVSNFYGNVGRILRDAGFGPLLSVVVDSNVVGLSKPDPAIYTLAVKQLGTDPAQTMHVGDSYERDVCAARAAGLRTAWLVAERTTPTGNADSVADLHLTSLDELAAALDGSERLAVS